MNSAASATRARHGPGRAAGVGRIDGDAAQAGLEREDAAPARRQAQRAADVGADVQRAVAGRGGGARTGAGAARACARGPRGCAPAGGSWTGPTTACRSRAWWSWPAARRRARAGARPAGHRRPRAPASVAAVPSGIGSPRVAMLSLMRDRHAVDQRPAARRSASGPRWRAPAPAPARGAAGTARAGAVPSVRRAPSTLRATSTGESSRRR